MTDYPQLRPGPKHTVMVSAENIRRVLVRAEENPEAAVLIFAAFCGGMLASCTAPDAECA